MFLYMTTVQTLLELMKEICQCDFLDFKQDKNSFCEFTESFLWKIHTVDTLGKKENFL